MGRYQFPILIEKDEDGIYIGSCPALQGCYTQGDTYEEVVENLKDAIRLHIEARRSQISGHALSDRGIALDITLLKSSKYLEISRCR